MIDGKRRLLGRSIWMACHWGDVSSVLVPIMGLAWTRSIGVKGRPSVGIGKSMRIYAFDSSEYAPEAIYSYPLFALATLPRSS